MKTCIVYARVSSKRQAADGLPVESQLDQCRVKADAMGATVLREFVDGGISGTTDRRPAFQSAIAFCFAMQVDYFITWSSSRFARNVIDAGRYKLLLHTSRTKLVYVSGEVDIDTDDGWLMDGINSLLDENYSRRVGTDTRRSMVKAASDGYFMGGRVPFGYAAVADGKRRRLAVHPSESEIIEKIYKLALDGLGVKLIAMELNDRAQFHRGNRWAKNTVNFILTSEVYTGISTFNRVRNRVPNPPELWIRVESHPAIIEKEVFEMAQQSLTDRRPERVGVGGSPRARGVFSGLLRCGKCDGALSMTHGTGRNGTRHFYYACNTHMRGKAKCTFKNVRMDVLDPALLSQLLDKVITPEIVTKVVNDCMTMGKDWAKERHTKRAGLVKEMREVEAKRSNLYGVLELHGKDAPNLGDIGPRLRVLNEQVRTLERELVRLEESTAGPSNVTNINIEEMTGMLRGLVQDCQDVKKQKAFLASFIEKATVSEDSVAVYYDPVRMMSIGCVTVPRDGKWLLDLGSNQGPTD